MQSGNYQAVLDACVLVPPALCDLLLRLAETPRLHIPRWSEEILDEVKRSQIEKIGFEPRLAESWRREVEKAFPDSMVVNYRRLIPDCDINEKDRHVLAAAIRCQADCIVTSNLKDFPEASCQPWNIEVLSPSTFLTSLYELNPAIVLSKIDDMSNDRKRTRDRTLQILLKTAPGFATRVASDLELDLSAE